MVDAFARAAVDHNWRQTAINDPREGMELCIIEALR